MKIKKSKNISHTKRPCCVSAFCFYQHFNNTLTNIICFFLKFFDFFIRQKSHYLNYSTREKKKSPLKRIFSLKHINIYFVFRELEPVAYKYSYLVLQPELRSAFFEEQFYQSSPLL